MFGLIAWVGRALLFLFVLRVILSFFSPRMSRPAGRPGPSGPRPGGPAPGGRAPKGEVSGGQLVRDPQCGTYVAQSTAIKVSRGGENLFFCSDKCRDEYAAAARFS